MCWKRRVRRSFSGITLAGSRLDMVEFCGVLCVWRKGVWRGETQLEVHSAHRRGGDVWVNFQVFTRSSFGRQGVVVMSQLSPWWEYMTRSHMLFQLVLWLYDTNLEWCWLGVNCFALNCFRFVLVTFRSFCLGLSQLGHTLFLECILFSWLSSGV